MSTFAIDSQEKIWQSSHALVFFTTFPPPLSPLRRRVDL